MIPSRVVSAHDEWTLPPTKYRSSKTFAGSAYHESRGRHLGRVGHEVGHGVAGVLAPALRQQARAHQRAEEFEPGRVLGALNGRSVLRVEIAPARYLREEAESRRARDRDCGRRAEVLR
jgi:hypothetical protein